MKRFFPILSILLIAFFSASCQNSGSKNQPEAAPGTQPVKADPKSFSGSMQELQETLTQLMPMVVDRTQYNDPKNQKIIERDVKRLTQLSKTVRHRETATSQDPSIDFISKAFSEDLERIDESLALGKRDFARYNLMNVTAYCIECHTRTSTGPSFKSPQLEQTLQKLSGLERGEFLLATRQFEAALSEFSKVIEDRLAQKNDFFGLDKAVRYSLSVTVKYLKDPKRSLAIVQKVRNSPGVPYYLQQNAMGWETAIKDWLKEPAPKESSIEAMLKRVRQWIQKAQQLQVGMVDRGGDIYFFRALSELHLILAAPLSKEQMGEALYLTGLSYEAVRELSTYSLHESYYESCVRKAPQSVWAQRCYRRIEESILFGFTGSSGVRLPEEEVRHLEGLKKLALPPGQGQ